MTVIQCNSAGEALSKICEQKLDRAEIQQLKSIHDDLCKQFRETDTLHTEMRNAEHLVGGRQSTIGSRIRRTKNKLDKINRQISAINTAIKYIETQA